MWWGDDFNQTVDSAQFIGTNTKIVSEGYKKTGNIGFRF
jgi:hypothetical protein